MSDDELNRKLPDKDDIRVEVTLRNAVALFERRCPDVAEISSQPRVCQEIGSRKIDGETLKPGWRLDLTMSDPRSGKP